MDGDNTGKTILKVAGGATLGALITKLFAAKPAEAAPVDEKLDYLIETDEAIIRLLGELKEGVDRLLEKEGLPTMITKQVPLAYTVAPLETIKIAESSPLTGRIKSVTIHFPEGCKALVDVAFGHGEVWVLPSERDTYIALNNACPTFPYDEPIEKDEHLWAEIRNGDGDNPHSIAVIATIIGTEE